MPAVRSNSSKLRFFTEQREGGSSGPPFFIAATAPKAVAMRWLIPLALMLVPAGAAAQPADVTSAYTKLDLDRCTPLDEDEVLGWMKARECS